LYVIDPQRMTNFY